LDRVCGGATCSEVNQHAIADLACCSLGSERLLRISVRHKGDTSCQARNRDGDLQLHLAERNAMGALATC